MSVDHDLERAVRGWVARGSERLPDSALDAALREISMTPQRRAGWLARRFRIMNSNRLRFGVAAIALIAAGVIAIVVGFRVDILRSPNDDTGAPGPDLEILNAELEGMWKSDVVYRDRFIDFMLQRGHAEADIEAFLDRGGVGRQTAFHLFFDGSGRSRIYETTQVTDLLSDEPYELLPDGRLRWGDLGCVVTTRFTIAGDRLRRLTFEPVSTTGCDADERIAMDAFFNFRPYTFDRGSPY